jgi:hypothetical protein
MDRGRSKRMNKDASDPDGLSMRLDKLSLGPGSRQRCSAGRGAEDGSIIYRYACGKCDEVYVGQTNHPKKRQEEHFRIKGTKPSDFIKTNRHEGLFKTAFFFQMACFIKRLMTLS